MVTNAEKTSKITGRFFFPSKSVGLVEPMFLSISISGRMQYHDYDDYAIQRATLCNYKLWA